MARLESSEQVIGVYGNEKCDFDRYNFVERTPLATKEISVIVDFEEHKVTGDTIAYGLWYDIETHECIELLKILQPQDIKRDFSNLINQ